MARGLDGRALAGVTGLRAAPLEVVEHRGLQAVVCAVDLAEFGEEPLARNLEDLAWLEEVARGHDDVCARRPPAGRGRADAAGDDLLRRRQRPRHGSSSGYDELVDALDRVEGRVSGASRPTPSRDSREPRPRLADGDGHRRGAAYLQRKREQANRRRAATETVHARPPTRSTPRSLASQWPAGGCRPRTRG